MTPEDIEVLKRAEDILDEMGNDRAYRAAHDISVLVSQIPPSLKCINCGKNLLAKDGFGDGELYISLGASVLASRRVPVSGRWCKCCLDIVVQNGMKEMAELLGK